MSFTRGASRSNGLGAFVDQGIISGLNLATFLVLARWMPIDLFGVYVLAYSIVLFAQTLQHALVTRAHNVLSASFDKSAYSNFTRSVLWLVLGLVIAVTLLTAAVATLSWSMDWLTLKEASFGLLLVLLPWMLQDAVRRILYSSERIQAAAANSAISYGLQISLIATMWLLGLDASLWMVFGAMGLSSVIAAGVGLWHMRSVLANSESSVHWRKHLTEMWTYGKWLTSGEIVGWLGQNGNTWIIGALLGAPLVAGYRAATYITNLLNPFDLAVSNYLPVKAAKILEKSGPEVFEEWLKKAALWLLMPYGIVVLGICVGSYALLDLFYDDRYVSDLLALVLSVAAISRWIGFAASFPRLGLMANRSTKIIFQSQVLAMAVYAVMGTAFIAGMGILGAPIARVFLHSVIGLYLGRALHKNLTETSSLEVSPT